MRKIKDRIILGIVSGIITGIPGRITNALQYKAGLTDVKYGQMASNLFMPSKKVNTKEAKVVASITNNTMLSITGVMVTYLLSMTGRDKAAVKGVCVTSSLWLGVYGLTARLGLQVKSKSPLSPILSYIDHALFGAACGYFVSKFGHDSLFPDTKISDTNPKEKLQLCSYKER